MLRLVSRQTNNLSCSNQEIDKISVPGQNPSILDRGLLDFLILSIKWNLVVRWWSSFFYVPTYLQYSTVQYSTVQFSTVQFSTVLLYMCSKQEHKVNHGHKKGHAPRAQEGRSPTGISRPRTEVLRTCTYFSASPQQTHCSEAAHRAGT